MATNVEEQSPSTVRAVKVTSIVMEIEKDHSTNATEKMTGVPSAFRGVLAGYSSSGEPLVDFLNNPAGSAVIAASTVPVDSSALNADVLLLFEDGDLARPVIVGILQGYSANVTSKIDVSADGNGVRVYAAEEIVLRCGQASITLTRAGKIVMRGTYVSSRSSGVNRIKGGSVQIN